MSPRRNGPRSFPALSEPPRRIIDRSLGRAPADWELFHGFWLVSARMKDVLEAVDREGVAFLECEARSGAEACAALLALRCHSHPRCH